MKILWMCHQLFSTACEACGYPKSIDGAWSAAVIHSLKEISPELEICVAYSDSRKCDCVIDGCKHISYDGGGKYYYKKIPSQIVERVQRIIKDFNPDIIHVQGTESFYGAFPKSIFMQKPVVVTLQGIISACSIYYAGMLTPYDLRGCNYNASYLIKHRSLWSDLKYWIVKRSAQEQKILRQHKYFIGRTNWDKACVEFYNCEAKYFHVNETLRPIFYETRRDPKKIKPYSIFCSAAANYPLKGAHWLIRAVASLKREFPCVQVRIASAKGKIDKDMSIYRKFRSNSYHAYLRKLIKELGVESNIVSLPSLSSEQMAAELKNAHLFVLPSLCENSSNSLGEAMLVGVPSIATFTGGTPSIMKDGIEGRLIPSSDPFALASAIRQWFRQPELAESCVSPARESALKRHSQVSNAKALMDVYSKILETERQ